MTWVRVVSAFVEGWCVFRPDFVGFSRGLRHGYPPEAVVHRVAWPVDGRMGAAGPHGRRYGR